MRRCWAEEAADRPDFHALKTAVRKINRWDRDVLPLKLLHTENSLVFSHALPITLTLGDREITERTSCSNKNGCLRFAYTVHLFIHVVSRKFTAIIRLRTINRLVFVMEMQPVYHGVGTKLSDIIYMNQACRDEGRTAEAWDSPNRCYSLAEIGGIKKTSTAASLYFSYFRAGTFPVISVECFWKMCALFLEEKLVYTVGISIWVRVL